MKNFFKFSGLFLSIFFLSYSFWQVSWYEFLISLKNIDSTWIGYTAVALSCSMFIRSIRWQIIIGLPRSDFFKVWSASCIGYLGTAIYPARAGDVLKILQIQKTTAITGGEALMSLIVDRIFDGLALGSLLLLLMLSDVRFQANLSLCIITISFVIISFLLSLYYFKGHYLKVLFAWVATKNIMGERLNRLYHQTLSGSALFKSPCRMFLCLIVQIVATSFDILACWLLFYAFGWTNLTIFPATVMLLYLAAAFSLPSTPGYIGVYQVASVFVLSMFGIDKSAAVAYGSVFQALTFILVVGFGIQAKYKKTQYVTSS